MRELFVEARADRVGGGYVASAIGYGIHTQAETPTVVHLRVIREEELVR